MSTPILARPIGTSACGGVQAPNPLFSTGFVVIPPGATVVVTQIPVSDYRSVAWFARTTVPTLNLAEAYEIFATHQNGASPTFITYSDLSTVIAHIIDVQINAGQLQLIITNNEAAQMIVYVTQEPLPAVPVPTITLPVNFSPAFVFPFHTSAGASTTTTVDIVSASRIRNVKWLLVFTNPLTDAVGCYEVFATTDLAAPPDDATVYNTSGDPFNITVDIQAVGANVNLIVTNNELFDLVVDGQRVTTFLPLSVLPPSACTNACEDLGCVTSLTYQSTVITPTNTGDVDTFNFLGYRAAKYFVAVTTTTNITASYHATILNKIGSPPVFVTYGNIGPVVNHTINVITTGIDVIFQITNNEAVNIIVDLIQIPVSI